MKVRVLAKTKTVSLTINDQEIRALDGEKLLWAALDNGIYIPTKICPLVITRGLFASSWGIRLPIES